MSKRNFRRRSRKFKKKTMSSIAKKVRVLERKVHATEKKNIDTGTLTAAVGTSGSIIALGRVVVGTAFNQRLGNKINFVSLFMRGCVIKNSAAVDQSFRMILVLDKKQAAGGAFPTIADILQISDTLAPINNVFGKNRFTVLWTKFFPLATSRITIAWKKFIRLNVTSLYYSTSKDAIQNMAFYMLILGSDNTNLATYFVNVRMNYYDS